MKWLKEISLRKTDDLCCFCPLNDDGQVVTGMNYMSAEPPHDQKIAGEFWFDNGEVKYRLYKDQPRGEE